MARLAEPLARLGETQVLAAPYEGVAAWFEQFEAVLAELVERALELAPAQSDEEGAVVGGRPSAAPLGLVAQFPAPLEGDSSAAALKALGAVIPALRATPPAPGHHRAATPRHRHRTPPVRLGPRPRQPLPGLAHGRRPRHPAAPARTARPARHRGPLRRHGPAEAGPGRPRPGHPHGRLAADRRDAGDHAGRLRTAGKTPVRAEFQYVEGSSSDQRAETCPLPSRSPSPSAPARSSCPCAPARTAT